MEFNERVAALNKMTYKELLRLWRYEPEGSPWFTKFMKPEFDRIMRLRRKGLRIGDAQRISEEVGWPGPINYRDIRS